MDSTPKIQQPNDIKALIFNIPPYRYKSTPPHDCDSPWRIPRRPTKKLRTTNVENSWTVKSTPLIDGGCLRVDKHRDICLALNHFPVIQERIASGSGAIYPSPQISENALLPRGLGDPSTKRRKFDDIDYEDAYNVVLQKALEVKHKTAASLSRLEEETAEKDKKLKDLEYRVAALEKDRAEVAEKLKEKTTVCEKLKTENRSLHMHIADISVDAKDILENYFRDMERLLTRRRG